MSVPTQPPSEPVVTRAERERQDRLDREARALRDNLRRRKQQSRAREGAREDAREDARRQTEAAPGVVADPGDC